MATNPHVSSESSKPRQPGRMPAAATTKIMSDNPEKGFCYHAKVGLPAGDTGVYADVFWLFTHTDKNLSPPGPRYLQWRKRLAHMGNGEMLKNENDIYNRALPKLQRCFLQGLHGLKWDLAIQAPSRAPHAGEYAMLIPKVNSNTPVVVIKYDYGVLGEKNSGQSATVEELEAAIILSQLKSRISEAREILIVDDIFANGKTAAAIVHKLRANGLAENAQVSVATVLRVFPSTKGLGRDPHGCHPPNK